MPVRIVPYPARPTNVRSAGNAVILNPVGKNSRCFGLRRFMNGALLLATTFVSLLETDSMDWNGTPIEEVCVAK